MINKESFKLSIIIPCYNEKTTINIILKKVIDSLEIEKILNYEIIIVDDHSKDGTIDLLKKLNQEKQVFIFMKKI